MWILRSLPSKWAADENGAIAVVFALTLTIALLLGGGAVDFGRAFNERTTLQAMLDASLSAGARAFSETGNAQTAKKRAVAFFISLAQKNDMSVTADKAAGQVGKDSATITVSVDPEAARFTGEATMNVSAPFLSIAGINHIPVTANAVAALAGKELELSVMLDITGSMDSYYNGTRKINDLKSAANDLIDIFKVNLSSGATRIALVPFSEGVNVGSSLAPLVRGKVSRTKSVQTGSWWRRRSKTYKLSTCVTERTGSNAYTAAPPAAGSYVGAMYTSNGSCNPSQQIVPLTKDEKELRDTINGLRTGGGTAGHIGTAWAWYMLKQSWGNLFPAGSRPASPDKQKRIKATILMTDGDYNTQYCDGINESDANCRSANGSSQEQAEKLCEAMKADGVVVYTVGFGIHSNSRQERLLKKCASDSTKHFFPYDGSALRRAFKEIGRQLAAGQAGVILQK